MTQYKELTECPLEDFNLGDRVNYYGRLHGVYGGVVVRNTPYPKDDGNLFIGLLATNEIIEVRPQTVRKLVKQEPREWWVNEFPNNVVYGVYRTKEEADKAPSAYRSRCFKVREVLE